MNFPFDNPFIVLYVFLFLAAVWHLFTGFVWALEWELEWGRGGTGGGYPRANEKSILFPIHPRTRKMMEQCGLDRMLSRTDTPTGLWPMEPFGYLELLHLNMDAAMILTDSGGLQEESTVLGVPCLTLRHNTERPVTCREGTNRPVGNGPDAIRAAAREILSSGSSGSGRVPEKWDGKAAGRIVEILTRV